MRSPGTTRTVVFRGGGGGGLCCRSFVVPLVVKGFELRGGEEVSLGKSYIPFAGPAGGPFLVG